MSHSAQAGLNAPQNDRAGGLTGVKPLGKTADDVGIDDGGTVGTAGVFAPGGVIIGTAGLFEGSVVGNHRIDAAGSHAPEKARLAQAGNIRIRFRVRLGNDPDAIAGVKQDLPDDGGTDKGTVNV